MTTTIPLIIYMVDFAGRDEVLCDPVRLPDTRYICFTDRDASDVPDIWEVHKPVKWFACPKLTSIWHKTHPHLFLPEHRFSLWLDASVGLKDFPPGILKSGFSGFAAMRHRTRVCLFEEAEFCRDIGVSDPEKLKRQLAHYTAMIPPARRPTGLWETGALLRDNSMVTQITNKLWWEHLVIYPRRDQVVLAYLNSQHRGLFANGMITDFPGTFSDSKYFTLTSHGGPLPEDPAEATKRFPAHMERKEQWAESVRQSSQERAAVVRLV